MAFGYATNPANMLKNLQNDPAVWNNKGVELDKLGKHEEAITAFDKAITIDPNYALAWYNKGLALDHLGKYAEAVKVYDQAIKMYNGGITISNKVILTNSNNAYMWYAKGNALFNLGNYNEAVKAYDQAIKGYNDVINEYAKVDHEAVIQLFQDAKKISPETPDIWYAKGNAFYHLNKYAEAVKAYDQAIKGYDDVVMIYDKIIARDPSSPSLEIGDELLTRPFDNEARKVYDKAMNSNPNEAYTAYAKGNAFYHLNKYAEAVKAYDQAITITPNDANIWHNKGLALDHLGKHQEAIKMYDKAKKLGYGN